MPESTKDKIARRSRVDANGCWIWQGARQKDRPFERAYGLGAFEEMAGGAHVACYRAFHGPIPDGLVVRHTCHVPPCVNPNHLILGTQKENVSDSVALKRHCHHEQHGMARLTVAKARAIRAFVANGVGQRHVARMFNVCQSTISQIYNGIIWRNA